MNNLFKNEKSIKLDKNYSMQSDGFQGIALIYSEERQREKEVTVKGKRVKTGEVETFLFIDKTYTSTVGQAIGKYIELSQNSSVGLKKIFERTNELLAIVTEFKEKYKNW